jgi:predicted NAD-dependent protein-ADP-ribosyltransferase YbiA (DUF1768 family)
MVKSVIDPKNINYNESKNVDDDDLYYASTRYNYTLYKKKIEIVLGKIRYTYSKYDVLYYPIYLVFGDEIDSKIGIFEIEANKSIEAIDDDGDVDLRKGNIIPFISEDYLKKTIAEYEKDMEFQEKHISNEIDVTEKEFIQNESVETEENNIDNGEIRKKQDDIFTLDIPENMNKNQKADETLKNGLFIEDKSVIQPPILTQETKIDSDKYKSEYTENPSNTWIEKFTKNNNYNIIDNEGGGDCFFAVIRDAFKQIGKIITVEKIRALISKNASEDIFSLYRTMYLTHFDELQNIDKELAAIKKTGNILKKRISSAESADIHKKLVDEAKDLLIKRDELMSNKEVTKETMKDFEYMKNIDTFEKFKEFILTRDFWADEWSISLLEHLLNVKFIILSQENFEEGDLDSVMRCEVYNNAYMKEGEKFNPDYYIMTTHTGNHYTLISYKNKNIFKFKEIPYDIKTLIINKCMEKNSGVYYLIQDFCNFKTELGLPSDCGKPIENEDEFLNRDLYDKDIVFRFYANSNKKPLAGKGSGETIPDTRINEFNSLNNKKNRSMIDWRKKLDDTWPVVINVDNHKWSTVKHYCLGSKFKNGFPDFYLEFSLDSDSKISKDLELAIIAGSASGKLESKILRKPEIKIDSDYNIHADEYRKKALISKFSQNLDLKKILLDTTPARLDHFVRRNETVPDELLMLVRKELTR